MTNELWKAISEIPDGSADQWLIDELRSWEHTFPTRDRLEEVRNQAVFTSACSDFVITLLNILIEDYKKFVPVPMTLTVTSKQ